MFLTEEIPQTYRSHNEILPLDFTQVEMKKWKVAGQWLHLHF